MEQERFDACMRRICCGEKDALREIYEAYMKYIFRIIFQVVQNHEDAEDLTGDFFIKLWTNSEQYVQGSSHKAYMATIARNLAIDYLRKKGREVLVSEFTTEGGDEENATMQVASGTLPNEAAATHTVEEEVVGDISLKEALDRLKPKEREVIHLKVMEELTFKEIAQVTGTPMGTVTWLYRTAIEKLRRCGYE